MVATSSDIKIDSFATTASAIVLSVAIIGSAGIVPTRDYPLPKIEAFISESLRSMNQDYSVRTPETKAAIVSGFIGKIAKNTRDLEPEVASVVSQKFWDLF